jgi:hypothetical protein
MINYARRAVFMASSISLLCQTAALAGELHLDLSSKQANISFMELPAKSKTGTATIKIGDKDCVFGSSDKLTAAEFFACLQVIQGQKQTLGIDAEGVAIGGGFALNADGKLNCEDLVVPHGVVLNASTAQMSGHQAPALAGNLVNYGSIIVTPTKSTDSMARLKAQTIVNHTGGLISTGSSSRYDLTVQTTGRIDNDGGAIVCSQALSLNSIAGEVSNKGVIKSDTSNITITGNASTLQLANRGGRIQAANGDINLDIPSSTGTGRVSLDGGDCLSRNLNSFAGGGFVDVRVHELSGVFKSRSGGVYLSTETSNLHIGETHIGSSLTAINKNGKVEINGAVRALEKISLIASGSIVAVGDAYLRTRSAAQHSRDVLLVAGADVTSSDADPADAKKAVARFCGASASGGNVNFSASTHDGPVIDTAAISPQLPGLEANGGNVVIAAFAGAHGNGNTQLPSDTAHASIIDTTSKSGKGGNVKLIIGAAIPSLNTDSILTAGSEGSSTLAIYASQPATSDGKAFTLSVSGDCVSNNSLTSTQKDGKIVLSGGSAPSANRSVRINSTDAAKLDLQIRGNAGICEDTYPGFIEMAGGTVDEFFLDGTRGLSITGDLNCATSCVISGVSSVATNGHTLRAGYLEIRGGFNRDNLVIGPDTKLATTTPSVNGGNITITAEQGQSIIIGSGTTFAPVAGGVTYLEAYTGIGKCGIKFAADRTESSSVIFKGPAVLLANSHNQSVEVAKGARVECDGEMHINTASMLLNGTLACNKVTYTYPASLAGGTIACSRDVLDLSKLSSLTFAGENTAIISAGKITDGGTSLVIDTSSAQGSGGNLTIIAGFPFSADLPDTGLLLDKNSTYDIAPSLPGKGAIELGHSILDTHGGKAGGDVAVFAHGPITLDAILVGGNKLSQTIPWDTQSNGNVKVIGRGVKIGMIDGSGSGRGYSPSVEIVAAEAAVSGKITVAGGSIVSGAFVAGAPGGNLSVAGLKTNLGLVFLTAKGFGAAIDAPSVSAHSLFLASGSGGIGTEKNPVSLSSGNQITADAGQEGDVFLKSEGAFLTGPNRGRHFDIHVDNNAISFYSNAQIKASQSVRLCAEGGYGCIQVLSGGAVIETPYLSLAASAGNIGGNFPLLIKAASLNVNTGKVPTGSVNLISINKKITLKGQNSAAENFSLIMAEPDGRIDLAPDATVSAKKQLRLQVGSGDLNGSLD